MFTVDVNSTYPLHSYRLRLTIGVQNDVRLVTLGNFMSMGFRMYRMLFAVKITDYQIEVYQRVGVNLQRCK